MCVIESVLFVIKLISSNNEQYEMWGKNNDFCNFDVVVGSKGRLPWRL